MSGSDRGDNTKAGLIWGIIAAALFAVAFIGWGLWKTAEYEREASNQAREYTAYTDEKIRKACLGLPPVNQKDCVAEARHEQRAYERDENDLVAQRKSALWAYIMGAAAVIGMGLSVIGVILVWTTFAETKRSNKIASDATEGQLRPWLALSVTLRSLKCVDGVLHASVTGTVKNGGVSPALYVEYSIVLLSKRTSAEQIFNWLPTILTGKKKLSGYKMLFHEASWEFSETARDYSVLRGPHYVGLIVAIRYRSPYSHKFRYTCQKFDLSNPSRSDELFDIAASREFPSPVMKLTDEIIT